jgi:hypothetical protein
MAGPAGTDRAALQINKPRRTAEHRVLPADHPQRVMRTAASGASLTAMVIALLALLGPVILPLAVPAPLPSKAMP